MAETNTLAPALQPEIAVQDQATAARERTLRELLPYDYEYAQREGLVGLFYYDPQTGEDGLMHTLAGELTTNAEGGALPSGFHHEPSAEYVWPTVTRKDGTVGPSTYVDRTHLSGLKSEKRRHYAEYPFEVWQGKVAIDGMTKIALSRDPKTGEVRIADARNTMYPNEYDALAVMQAVRIAYEGRDHTQDKPAIDSHGKDVIVNDSSAPLVDGKTPMRIRLVLDRASGKVKTAVPLLSSRPGVMRLSEDEIKGYVFGDQGTIKQ